MGLNNQSNYFAIDYMLGTICLVYYLLVIKYFYTKQINVVRTIKTYFYYIVDSLFISSQNNNNTVALLSLNNSCTDIQSAENWKGFSETTRQLSIFNNETKGETEKEFWQWFAGIIDGRGNFDIRSTDLKNKLVLKAIRIKLHNRDVRILTRIQNLLHRGKIRSDKNKPHSILIIDDIADMDYCITNLNGLIRVKVSSFIKSCNWLGLEYREANYNIEAHDPYFSGLIDTDGTIAYNYSMNRIECNLEMRATEYVKKLNFDSVIPHTKPYVSERLHTQKYSSRSFKFQNVEDMVYIYEFFMKNRLYSDFKFYRVSKIKPFLEIRSYKNSTTDSQEYKIYSDFILDWVQYKNPLWYKLSYINKLR